MCSNSSSSSSSISSSSSWYSDKLVWLNYNYQVSCCDSILCLLPICNVFWWWLMTHVVTTLTSLRVYTHTQLPHIMTAVLGLVLLFQSRFPAIKEWQDLTHCNYTLSNWKVFHLWSHSTYMAYMAHRTWHSDKSVIASHHDFNLEQIARELMCCDAHTLYM